MLHKMTVAQVGLQHLSLEEGKFWYINHLINSLGK